MTLERKITIFVQFSTQARVIYRLSNFEGLPVEPAISELGRLLHVNQIEV